MYEIVAISAGMYEPKKGAGSFRRAHQYLNYGLLNLVTKFGTKGIVIHGNFDHPYDFLTRFYDYINDCKLVFLSLPSFYALSWAKDFLDSLRQFFPEKPVHVGGRWVIDKDYEVVAHRLAHATALHTGLGESHLTKLSTEYGIPLQNMSSNSTYLDYSKLYQAHEYNPSIEVSRGCGLGCAFCEEANVPLQKLKSPSQCSDEISNTMRYTGVGSRFYFESSFFAPSTRWVDEFQMRYEQSDQSFVWRTETRVDSLSRDKLLALYRSGLRVLDLGLESASPNQLRAMGKTTKPMAYLESASRLLTNCADIGIKAKVNILLYSGETIRTLEETLTWLRHHEDSIFGVSVYPVLVFGFGQRKSSALAHHRANGAQGLQATGTDGIWYVDLSEEIDATAAKTWSSRIAREFMDAESYYYLKKFSYFPVSYTWRDFVRHVRELEFNDLPFSLGNWGDKRTSHEIYDKREQKVKTT